MLGHAHSISSSLASSTVHQIQRAIGWLARWLQRVRSMQWRRRRSYVACGPCTHRLLACCRHCAVLFARRLSLRVVDLPTRGFSACVGAARTVASLPGRSVAGGVIARGDETVAPAALLANSNDWTGTHAATDEGLLLTSGFPPVCSASNRGTGEVTTSPTGEPENIVLDPFSGAPVMGNTEWLFAVVKKLHGRS